MNKEALREALKDLAPRPWEDRPLGPVVDYPGQRLSRESLWGQLGSEATRDDPWFLKTIRSRLAGTGWARGASYHRRFWIAERIEWVLDAADEGGGEEWLERWICTAWRARGWKPVVERLVEEEIDMQRHQD